MRLGLWNIEWFDALFDAEDRLLADAAPSKRPGVTRRDQVEAIGGVLRALDADAFLIAEAPNDGARSGRSTVRALEGFAAAFGLRQNRALHGFSSTTHQELALLYDPARIVARHDPMGARLDAAEARRAPLDPRDPARWGAPFPAAPRFDGAAAWRPQADAPVERIAFTRPPLEAALCDPGGAWRCRLIGFHLKSLRARPGADLEAVRRRHLGQCVWLRARIDEHLSAGDPLIALGDLNQRGVGEGPASRAVADDAAAAIGEAAAPGWGTRGRAALMSPPPGLAGERRLRCGAPGAPRAASVRWRTPEDAPAAARVDEILASPALWAAAGPWRVWAPWSTAPEVPAEVAPPRAENAGPDAAYDREPGAIGAEAVEAGRATAPGRRRPELVAAIEAASDHAPITLDLDPARLRAI